MKRNREMGFQVHRRHEYIYYLICCLTMFVSIFLTACGQGAPNDDNISNGSNSVSAVQKPEWVYVPERIEIADKQVDYSGMQLVGDTVCYISRNGEAEASSACPY